MVTSQKERIDLQGAQFISFVRSPLDFKNGDVTKGKSLLIEGADYLIYEKPPGF